MLCKFKPTRKKPKKSPGSKLPKKPFTDQVVLEEFPKSKYLPKGLKLK